MNLGQIVQSHALSFFHLSAPDFLLGYDADPAKRNIFGLIAAHPELAREGIRLRQFGQEIIEILAGKTHPLRPGPCPAASTSRSPRTAGERIRDGLPEAFETIAQDARDLQACDGHATRTRRASSATSPRSSWAW